VFPALERLLLLGKHELGAEQSGGHEEAEHREGAEHGEKSQTCVLAHPDVPTPSIATDEETPRISS
jgi:hypothetical protein